MGVCYTASYSKFPGHGCQALVEPLPPEPALAASLGSSTEASRPLRLPKALPGPAVVVEVEPRVSAEDLEPAPDQEADEDDGEEVGGAEPVGEVRNPSIKTP